jgi:hypothetical protein
MATGTLAVTLVLAGGREQEREGERGGERGGEEERSSKSMSVWKVPDILRLGHCLTASLLHCFTASLLHYLTVSLSTV